ncbi:hemolysin III family protein [Lacinutrix sp. MedPE-SW]|uniref:PAQR family membrane homeostasis protein TrhA n=1 Tax=Lacinutrix sp. MedPE-SW TaxID=1860087 RepID=UPI0009164573|nr:hemolysin III family protein [Lacinutrix sp. MedPE-SW]OIQ22338.1 MAG: hemolysin III family protein [Lacinutrix sp. MedPE-SW]
MRIQTPFEEKWNTITHAFGAVFGIVGLILLILKDTNKTEWSFFSVTTYGITFIVLFLASALYHYVSHEKYKHYFRIADHINIYFLIAGTYSPITLITLEQSLGWTLFTIVWSIAAFGIVLKLFFTGRFEILSLALYLIMGWLIVFDYSALQAAMPQEGVWLLMAGGLFYTLGVVFYAIEKIPYNHVIWHIFVLAGAVSHFFMVYFFVV